MSTAEPSEGDGGDQSLRQQLNPETSHLRPRIIIGVKPLTAFSLKVLTNQEPRFFGTAQIVPSKDKASCLFVNKTNLVIICLKAIDASCLQTLE